MTDKSKPIGVFDSGIGGLTVLKALVERLPGESFVYFGDTARVPYGTKSPPVVKQFSLQNSLFLLKQEVKLIVVACNSSSAAALEFLRGRLSLPLVGVIEPGVQAALREGGKGMIGVIGTRATIDSGAYQRELQNLQPEAKFMAQACPLFVPLVEEGLVEGSIADSAVEHYLQPMRDAGVEALILGCTHYPLLQPAIAKYMGSEVKIIDSPAATAEAALNELQQRGLMNSEGGGDIKFFASDVSSEFTRLSRRFFGGELPPVEKVEFEVADFWV